MRRFSSRARLALAGGLALLLGSAGTALGQTAPGIPSGAVWNYMASSDLSFDLELSVTNPAPPPVTRGFLRREVYTNIPYGTVAALTNDPKFPDHPDLVEVVPSFEAPSFWDDNYGQRLVGYLLPPATGNYVFYISSDDQGLLYLSPDENPAHKAVIAREDTWSPARTWNGNSFSTRTNAANISAPIRLEARRSYYVEALHKEAGGGDSLGVAWQLPGESQPPSDGSPPIGGEFLSLEPLPRPLPPQVALLFPANGMLFTAPTNLTLTAQASDPDGWITQVEFFAGEASLGSPPASGASMVWSNVQAGAYVLSARTTDNTGLMATSAPVNITVQAPPPPPITNRELHLVGLYEGMAAAVIVNCGRLRRHAGLVAV